MIKIGDLVRAAALGLATWAILLWLVLRDANISPVNLSGAAGLETVNPYVDISSLIAVSAGGVVGLVVWLAQAAGRFLWLRFSRPIGARIVEDPDLLAGLKAQASHLADHAAWPPHRAMSKPAHRPGLVGFGDARFTTSPGIRALIRSFLGRGVPLRGAVRLKESVMLVTGEPGAGKSVLTQEIHHSLYEGLARRRHGFVPLVIFAADLTLDGLAGKDLQTVLAGYFHRMSGDQARLERFIQSSWNDHDFLIIVDGLDEISQRSRYAAVQERLKALISQEAHSAIRARRFILSCRAEDDIGVFSAEEATPVILHGLSSETVRRQFCANLVRNANLNATTRTLVADVLERSSRTLTSADVFRRNPYFLSLLLLYFERIGGRPIRPVLNFQYLMDDYIARETERGALDDGTALPATDGRKRLRRDLEKVAFAVLKQVAFGMTASQDAKALYGSATINAPLVKSFVKATTLAIAPDEDHWGAAALVVALASPKGLSADQSAALVAQGFFNEIDLLVLAEAMRKLGPGQPGREEILSALGNIPRLAKVDTEAWYARLADQIAVAAADLPAESGAATLLFARGLAAAHALRLIYIEGPVGGLTVRFRHRRLAEYFAAGYLKARWAAVRPDRNSPWLTPVLNLLCALEDETAPALEWMVDGLAPPPQERRLYWRAQALGVVEAAAFSPRDSQQLAAFDALFRKLAGALEEVTPPRSDKNSETVTRVVLAHALAHLARLRLTFDAGDLFSAAQRRETRRPVGEVAVSGEIISAFEDLASRRRSLVYRASSLSRALLTPGSVLFDPRMAIRQRRFSEWWAALALVMVIEGAFAGLLALIFAEALTLALPFEDAPETLASGMAIIGLTVLACVLPWRAYGWWRDPSRASTLTAVIALFVITILNAIFAVARFVVRAILNIPRFLRELPNLLAELWRNLTAKWRALPCYLLKFLRVVWTMLPFLIVIVTIIGMVIAATVLLTSREPSATPSGSVSASQAAPVRAEPSSSVVDRATVPIGPSASVDTTDTTCADIQRMTDAVFYWPFATASENPAQIESDRRQLGLSVRAIAEANLKSRCGFPKADGQWQLAEDRLVDDVLRRNPVMLPYAEAAPTFDGTALGKLNRDLSSADALLESDVRGLSAFYPYSRAVRLVSALRQARDTLVQGRRTGRITARDDGTYETPDAFPAFALTLPALEIQIEDRLALLSAQKAELGRRTLQASLWLVIFTPLIVFGSLALQIVRQRRRDDRDLRRLSSVTLRALVAELPERRLSFAVKRKLLARIRTRTEVSDEEIEWLEEAAGQLNRRWQWRDRQFGAELTDLIADLSSRVTHRSL